MTFPRKNNIKRMLFYLSFSASAFIATLLIKKHDVVFSSSPPIFHVFSAMIAAKIKGSRFVLDIRDIWPDTALEFKAVKNKYLLKLGSFLERRLYKNAKLISTISNGSKEVIEGRGGAGKTSVIYNGSDEDMLNWGGDREKIRDELGWSGKFIVCYAGLLGLGQNLVDILPEIELIKDNNVKFVFIGDGPGRGELVKQVTDRKLGNVEFKDLMPRKEILSYIHSADIMMVILRETDFFRSAVPSKVFDYMAAGRPVITNVDGELRKILSENDAGLYFSLQDKDSFGIVINKLKNDPAMRSRMGAQGKELIRRKYLRSVQASELVKQIEL